MQKPGRTTQPKDRLRLAARAVLPPRSTPGRQSGVSRRSGLRGSLSRQVRPARALSAGSWGEAGEVGGRGGGGVSALWDGWGRLLSRQVQYSQCNGFLLEDSLCAASRRSSGGAGARRGRGQSWSSPWHHGLGQAGPEGMIGLPSPPGHQQRALRQVGGAGPLRLSVQSSRPRGLLFPSSGLHTLQEIQRRCPAL